MLTKTRSFKTSLTSLRGKSWIRIVIGSLSAATSQETSYLQAIQHQGFYSQRFSLSIEASRPPKNILWTKPQLFLCRDLILRGIAIRGGAGQKFPGSKIQFFFSLTLPRRAKLLIFFLPWQGIGSFWQGICTFWQEFVCFGKNLYVLARQDQPQRGKFWLFSRQPCPREENFDFFLANPTPARINSKFFLAGLFLTTHFSSPTRLTLDY